MSVKIWRFNDKGKLVRVKNHATRGDTGSNNEQHSMYDKYDPGLDAFPGSRSNRQRLMKQYDLRERDKGE